MRGYNYALKASKYGKEKLDSVERKLEGLKIEYKRDTYGLYFKSVDWAKVMEVLDA